MLRLVNIDKKFGRRLILKKVNFEIKSGSITGLLGVNGAGKTTTMRVISGVFAADKGQILYRGQIVNPLDYRFHRQIGYLPENNPLYPFLTPREYLGFIGQIRQIPHLNKQISKLAQALFFVDHLQRPIHQLSKGYRQRVGLAATLLGNPPLLILDEPMAGLDPNQQRLVRNFISRLKTTILLSSHILAEVQEICNRVVIINRGRIASQGPMEQLLEKPMLKITLEGTKIAFLKKILKGKNIKIVHSQKQGKAIKLELTMDKDMNMLRKIIWDLVRKHPKWQLYQLESGRQKLDEIFQQLTRI